MHDASPITMFYSTQFQLLIFMLPLVFSGNATAEWLKVGDNTTTIFYASLTSIRIEEGGVKMWNLLDLKVPDTSTSPPYLSMKSLAEYNCKDMTYRFLESQNFSANMGAGVVVLRNAIGEWSQVPPRSAVKTLWNIACGKTPF